MGTNQCDMATETPPAIHQRAPFTADKFSIDALRPKSLKRERELSPASASNLQSGSASPSKFARLAGQTSRHQSPLVSSPALGNDTDGRWSEEDSTAGQALEKELASTIMASVSIPGPQPLDAPEPPPPAPPAAPMSDAQQHRTHQSHAASPAAPVAVMADQVKTEPSPQSTTSPEGIELDGQLNRPSYSAPQTQAEGRPTPSISYPHIPTTASTGPSLTPLMPQRTVTHPMPISQEDSPSSGEKPKHRCPFCETVFTRHHNLKSHMLTHSHEKPYQCHECQLRFRRLHDLKRHGKLHTGEKPHKCPKCGREFARGDALARHSKGTGGCASRRHSATGYAGGEDDLDGHSAAEGDEATMSGVVYEGSNDIEMTAPSSRTYPSVNTRSGGLYAPNSDRSLGNSAANATQAAIATASLYAHNAMTESPKPLSPHGSGGQVHQTQTQPNSHHRSSEGLSPPPPPPSHSNATGPTDKSAGVTGFPTADARFAAIATSGTSSHSRTSSGPHAESGNLFSSNDQLWAYFSGLEKRVQTLEKEKGINTAQISQLRSEVTVLAKEKAELALQVTQLKGETQIPQHGQISAGHEPSPVPTIITGEPGPSESN